MWRDEANTIALATLPTISGVWQNLQYDSFPIVWLGVVRLLSAVAGPMNDSAFRVLGFFVGVSLVGALWFNARVFGHRYPVVALALVALSPSVIRWGDSMRAYGIGMVLIVVTAALIWRFTDTPSVSRFVAATIVGVLSVHSLYYNSVLLLAFCAGATAVACSKREWKVVCQLIGIGGISALSLLPYTMIIRQAESWNSLVRIPHYTFDWFWIKLFETIAPAGVWVFFVWIALLALVIPAGMAALLPRGFPLPARQREVALFALVTLLTGAVGSFAFLRTLSYYTQPWYYLTLMLVVGLSVDILLGAIVRDNRLRMTLSLAALVVGFGSVIAGWPVLNTRLTNADIVSSMLQKTANEGDFIVVNPWYDGVSFDRYYRGHAPWMTVPAIGFHKYHRYDLIMSMVQSPDTVAPVQVVMDKAGSTLNAGGTVFLVGALRRSAQGVQRSTPTAATAADQASQDEWSSRLDIFLARHALQFDSIAVASDRPVSRYENMGIVAIRGWRR